MQRSSVKKLYEIVLVRLMCVWSKRLSIFPPGQLPTIAMPAVEEGVHITASLVHNSNGWLSGKWVISGSCWYGSNACTLIFHQTLDLGNWMFIARKIVSKSLTPPATSLGKSWSVATGLKDLFRTCAPALNFEVSRFSNRLLARHGMTGWYWMTLFGGKPLGKWHDDMILWYLVIFTLLGYPSELTRTCWLVLCIRSVVLSGQTTHIYIIIYTCMILMILVYSASQSQEGKSHLIWVRGFFI